MLDYRVSIFDPTYQTLLNIDASADMAHGQMTYEDTPDGCGAGKLNLGLYYDGIFARGYYSAFNVVEIHTADNTLTTASSAVTAGNTAKFYLDTNWGYDPARGEDSQVAYFYNGSSLTMRCPVNSVGFDSAPTVVHSASGHGSTTAVSVSITTPAAGNYLIAILTVGSGITGTTPTGFTAGANATNTVKMAGSYKVASGSETTVTATLSGATAWNMVVYEVSGGGVPAFTFDATQSSAVVYAPAVTPTTIGSMVISAFGIATGGNLSQMYGWSTLLSPQGTSSANNNLACETVQVSDLNPYQATGTWAASTAPAGVLCSILIAPSGTPKPYILCGTPLGGGGIPAYAIGTFVGRRRYTGRITGRSRGNDMVPTATITLQGLGTGIQQAYGDFIVANTSAIDIGTAIYDVLNLFASQWPYLTIAAANFPMLGQTYNGTNRDVSADSIITTLLQAISSLDVWHLRVGHDGTPRLLKLYNGPQNSYVYNVSFPFGVINYEPQNLDVEDMDCSNVFNRVKVIGDNDPVTGIPVSAIVDGSAGSPYNLILDGDPVQLQGIGTTAECASAAQSLLNQQSIARSNLKVRIYTRNDFSTYGLGPGNMQQGDVVRAVANITISNFNTTNYLGTNYTPPSIYGIGVSVVTTIDNEQLDRYQDIQFSAIEPDYTAAFAEVANATSTALKINTQTVAGLDEYFVGGTAYPLSFSGLVVTAPTFPAVFALGSSPITCGGNNFTVNANATSWAWLTSSNTWSIQSTGTIVANAIPYAMFTANATTILGWQPLAQIGLLSIPGTYFASTVWTPSISGVTTTPAASVNGLAAAVKLVFTVSNQPTDNSLARINIWARANGTGTWGPVGGINAISGTGPSYTVYVNDLTVGTNYDFGMTGQGINGTYETSPVTTIALNVPAGNVALPAPYMLGGNTTLTPTFSGVSYTTIASANGFQAGLYVSFTITNQPTDASLSRINYWYQIHANNNGIVNPGANGFGWLPAGGVDAVGLGSLTPSASGTYSFAYDLTPGIAYDIAVSFENTQGGESYLGIIVSSVSPTVIGVPAPYLLEGSLITPTVTGPSGTGSPALTVSVAGKYTSQLDITFQITNQPTDGSLVKIVLYYRQSGQPTWLQFATNAPQNASGTQLTGGAMSAAGKYDFLYSEAANGVTYEFGVAMESNRGTESAVTSLGTVKKSLSVPTGTTLAIGSATNVVVGTNSTTTTITLQVSHSYTISGTTDMSWVDHYNVLIGYYNPGGGSSANQVVQTIPLTNPPTTGTLTYYLTLAQNANFTGPTTTFSYLIGIQFVAADGSLVASSTNLYTHT